LSIVNNSEFKLSQAILGGGVLNSIDFKDMYNLDFTKYSAYCTLEKVQKESFRVVHKFTRYKFREKGFNIVKI